MVITARHVTVYLLLLRVTLTNDTIIRRILLVFYRESWLTKLSSSEKPVFKELKIGEFLCLYDQGGDTIEQLVGFY